MTRERKREMCQNTNNRFLNKKNLKCGLTKLCLGKKYVFRTLLLFMTSDAFGKY